MPIDKGLVHVLGAEVAIALERLAMVWSREAQRGARWVRYADKLLSEDTGLSYARARRARELLVAIGIAVYEVRGSPPAIEYDVAASLERLARWAEANGLRPICVPAQINLRRDANQFAPGRKTDLDLDLEREIAQLASKHGWSEAEWQQEAQAIKARCAERGGVRDLAAYTRAALLTAAQAGPPPKPQPRRRQDARRRLQQVSYTESDREAARARVEEELARIQAFFNRKR